MQSKRMLGSSLTLTNRLALEIDMSSLCKGFIVHISANYFQNRLPNQLSFRQRVDKQFQDQLKM